MQRRAAIPLSPLVRQYQLNPHLKRKDGDVCTPEAKDRRAHTIYEICDDIVCSNNLHEDSLISCPKETSSNLYPEEQKTSRSLLYEHNKSSTTIIVTTNKDE